ncbi:MAG: hypothetical protein V7742_07280 [Halioglobus sp.]
MLGNVIRSALRGFLATISVIFGLGFCTAINAAGWVAVGENGTIISSPDGINWSLSSSPTTETLFATYFNGTDTWVASGSRGTLLNSTDALNWNSQVSGNTDALWSTTFAGGQWIVGGGNGRVLTSADSVNWTSVNGRFPFTLFDIAYDGVGLYTMSGDSGFANTALTSTDAVTWTQRPPSAPNNVEGLYGISFGAGQWTAVGDVGTIITTNDPDSRNWTGQSSGTSANLRDIVHDVSGWVVVGEGGVILTSPDAVNWTARSSGTTQDLWGIEYDPAGLYVVVGFGGTILTSTDAITWTPRTSPTSQRLRDVAIGKLPQEITFPAQDPLFQTFSVGATYPLNPQASASSGLPVSYTVLTPASCSLAGVTVTMIDAGECRIEATQAGDETYLPAAPVNQSILQLTPAGPGLPTNPRLVFDPQDTELFVPGGTFTLTPPASTTQTPVNPQPEIVYVSDTPSICTIPFLGSIDVTMLAVGTCTIIAASAPTDNYLLGGPETGSIQILPRPQSITFAAQGDQDFIQNGTFTLNPAASASSGLPVSYTSLNPSVCTAAGTTISMLAAGPCVIEASQAGDSTWEPASPVTQSITIVQTIPPAPPRPVPALPLPLTVLLVLLMGFLGVRYQRA